MDNFNLDLFRSRIDIFILKILSEQDRYGYEILEILFKDSFSHYEIKQSTLYSVLKRLENEGLLSTYDGTESNGAKRKYYSLTPLGKDKLNQEQSSWEFIRTLLDNLVSDKSLDLSAITPPISTKNIKPLTQRKRSNEESIQISQSNDEELSTEFRQSINFGMTTTPNNNNTGTIENTFIAITPNNVNASPTQNNYNTGIIDNTFIANTPNNNNTGAIENTFIDTTPRNINSSIADRLLFAPLPLQDDLNMDSDLSTNNGFPSLSDFGKKKNENTNAPSNSQGNYKDILSDIYNAPEQSTTDLFSNEDESTMNYSNSVHYNDLILTLRNENIIAKKYKKTNTLNNKKPLF